MVFVMQPDICKMGQRILCCETLTVDPRIILEISGARAMSFCPERLQFPVRLAFAMTINKSRRLGFNRIWLYIHEGYQCFTHGQLYVAKSGISKSSNRKQE